MALNSEVAFTSRDQALAVPEILESILLQVPLPDLLVNAQRVNHAWKRAIDSSPPLQQALFLQPATLRPDEKPYFNPCLQKAFPPWFEVEARYGSGDEHGLNKLPWTKNQAAFSRKEASWRKMLPIQPAATILKVVHRDYYPRASYDSVGEKKFEEGVRMGVLYDKAYKTVVEPDTSFHLTWNMMEVPNSTTNGNEGINEVKAFDPSQIERNVVEKKEIEKDVVTMSTSYTFQCLQNMEPNIGKEFRSQGFEDLVIEMGESRRIR
jgi:hypothetical protein